MHISDASDEGDVEVVMHIFVSLYAMTCVFEHHSESPASYQGVEAGQGTAVTRSSKIILFP